MTQRPRARRRGERGSAVAFVAVAATALIAVTGLAIDGGMAAGAYRHAQNAADAGALAAARQEYLAVSSVPPVNATASSLTPVAQTEVQHNGAQLTSVTAGPLSGSGSSPGGTLWVPSSGAGNSATAAFAEVSGQVTAPPVTIGGITTPGATFDADTVLNRAYGTIKMDTVSGVQHGSTASAETEWLYFNSQALNQTNHVNCSTASAGYNAGSKTIGPPTDCSNPALPAPLSNAATVVANDNPDAEVSAANVPSSQPSINVASASYNPGNPSIPVSASSIHSDDNIGWDTNGNAVATANVSATNVSMTSGPLDLTASNLAMSLTVYMGPSDTHPTVTQSCAPATVTFTGGITSGIAGVSWTGNVASDCSVTNMQSQVGTVTVTGDWSPQPQPLDWHTACSYSSPTWSCPVQTCLLRILESTTGTTICLLESNVGFGVKALTIPTTGFTTIPGFLGPVTVVANLPQTTYFMRVLGWNQTDPSASATAAVGSVIDESDAAFSASPFGMPDAGTSMGGPVGAPAVCFQYLLTALQPGCYYYMDGSSMPTYNPSSMPAGWQGQLTGDSGHKVGSTAVGTSGVPTTPLHYYGSSAYYLEPVFDAGSKAVLYYAVFLPVAGHANWGLLVNSVPSLNGPIVFSADTGSNWTTLNPGAVSIKVTQ